MQFKQLISNKNTELLKWIAIISMTIDHIVKFGNIYVNDVTYILGRLAFPLFVIILSFNYENNTRSKEKYIFRLLVFSIISQGVFGMFGFGFIPFTEGFRGNIFITLSLGLLIYNSYEKNNIFYMFVFSIMSLFLNVDYGIFGIAFIISILMKNIYLTYLTYFLSEFIVISNYNELIYISIIIPLLIILLCCISFALNINIKRGPKYFFYIYYPLHLFIIGMIFF